MKEIIINKNENGIIVALLENGKLVEEYDNINNTKTLEGNIYCGIVRNVLPNMQSAFVDIGESKNAFIHIKDITLEVIIYNAMFMNKEILFIYKIFLEVCLKKWIK